MYNIVPAAQKRHCSAVYWSQTASLCFILLALGHSDGGLLGQEWMQLQGRKSCSQTTVLLQRQMAERGTVATHGSLHHIWTKGGGRKGKQTHHLSSLEDKCLDWRDSNHCLSAFYGLWKGTDVPHPLERDRCSCPRGRLVSSCMTKGIWHREIKDCDGDIQGVSCLVQELTEHSYGSLQQCGTATLVLILAISSPTAQLHIYQPSRKGITV